MLFSIVSYRKGKSRRETWSQINMHSALTNMSDFLSTAVLDQAYVSSSSWAELLSIVCCSSKIWGQLGPRSHPTSSTCEAMEQVSSPASALIPSFLKWVQVRILSQLMKTFDMDQWNKLQVCGLELPLHSTDTSLQKGLAGMTSETIPDSSSSGLLSSIFTCYQSFLSNWSIISLLLKIHLTQH